MKKLAWFLLASNFILTVIVLIAAFATYDFANKSYQQIDYLVKSQEK